MQWGRSGVVGCKYTREDREDVEGRGQGIQRVEVAKQPEGRVES